MWLWLYHPSMRLVHAAIRAPFVARLRRWRWRWQWNNSCSVLWIVRGRFLAVFWRLKFQMRSIQNEFL